MKKIILFLFCICHSLSYGALGDKKDSQEKNIVQGDVLGAESVARYPCDLVQKVCNDIDSLETFSGNSFLKHEYTMVLRDIHYLISEYPVIMLDQDSSETILIKAFKSMNPDLTRLILFMLNKDIYSQKKDALLNAPWSNGQCLLDCFLGVVDTEHPAMIKIFAQLVHAGLKVTRQDQLKKLQALEIDFSLEVQ